jgi:hypothetical protein
MTSTRRTDMSEEIAELVPERPSGAKAKLAVTLGRGRTGKSTFVRVMVERTQDEGREIAIADDDRTNATLAAFLRGVVRPEHSDETSVHDWLDALINQQAEDQVSIILDMGGGDQVFKGFARSLELAALLDGAGILPVALHFIGPDIDDLAYLTEIEESDAFCPPQTILVLNEGLIRDARQADAAFVEIRKHATYRAALKRGAREIVFPRLSCMQEVNARRLSFADAQSTLGLTNRQRVAIWRREVAKALEPVNDWLP